MVGNEYDVYVNKTYMCTVYELTGVMEYILLNGLDSKKLEFRGNKALIG